MLLKGEKSYKYRGMQTVRSFAEFALNPFIHEKSLDIDAIPRYREGLEHYKYVMERMGRTCTLFVEQGFKVIGYSHLDFTTKAIIAFSFVMLPINILLFTCCVLSWELFKSKREEAELEKRRLDTREKLKDVGTTDKKKKD